MMKFELGIERPNPNRTWISAMTIGVSYFAGGIVPLVPYMLVEKAATALWISIGVTLVALFCFGYGKAVALGVFKLI